MDNLLTNSKKDVSKIIVLLLSIFGILLVATSMLLWLVEVAEIIAFVTVSNQLNSIQINKLQLLINEFSLSKLKFACSLFTILYLCMLVFYRRVSILLAQFLSTFFLKTGAIFKGFNNSCRIIITLIISFKIFLLFYTPLQLDELFSYLFISSKGLAVSILYYPGPNNHIAYNVFVALLLKLNLPVIVATRTPSLLADICILLVLFHLVKNYINHNKLAFLIFVASFSTSYLPYSILGRGYALQSLFSLIAVIAVFKYQEDKRFFTIVLIIVNALGFWVLPTHLFAFVPTMLMFVILHKNIFHSVKVTLLVLGTTLLLYFPTFAINGVNAIINNSWVKGLSAAAFNAKLPVFLLNYLKTIVGFESNIFTLLLLIGMITMLLIKNQKKEIITITCFVLTPIIILSLQHVIPFLRVFIFANLLFTTVVLLYLIQKKHLYIMVIFATVQLYLATIFTLQIVHRHNHSNENYKQLSKQLVAFKSKNIKHIAVKDELLAYQMELLNREQHFNLIIKWNQDQQYGIQY